jgi:predicted glutamine amidotransferase
MCGIAGVKKYGTEPISVAEIEILLCSLEVRGNHATGIALMTGDNLVIHKMPLPAWSFVKDAATIGFLKEHLTEDTDTVLLHTRYATCGDPNVNDNNHPMFDGQTAVVHNGSIRNADSLFTEMKFDRFAATDSDIIRAMVSENGFGEKTARQLSRCFGSAAIAVVDVRFPGQLLLGRSGNPLIVAHANDKLYFASEVKAIQKAVRPWEVRYGVFMRPPARDFSYAPLTDNTLYLFKPDHTAEHFEMRIAAGFQPVKYASHDNYAEKMLVWKSDKMSHKVFTRCRKCSAVQGKASHSEWKNLKCCKCEESFAYLEKEAITA